MAPSTKIVVPSLTGAIATLVLAFQRGHVDPVVFATAATVVFTAVLGYLVPHKPVGKGGGGSPGPGHGGGHHRKPPVVVPEFVTVWDSTRISAIGRLSANSRDIVAGYDDGIYNNIAEARRDYPRHVVFSICVHPGDEADFLDCEPGDARPADVIPWCKRMHAIGHKLVGVYADGSDWLEIRAIAAQEGFNLSLIVKWIAQPTSPPHPHIPLGYDGCQYDWEAGFDKSIFYSKSLRLTR